MARSISNRDAFIDSRDVIARVDELRQFADDWTEENDPIAGEFTYEDFAEAYPDEWDELQELEALVEEASGAPDWEYGATLIRDSFFEEYARDNRIDWEAAADDLKMDYFSVDFDGVTYWTRG